MMWQTLLAIALGGALGALSRFGLLELCIRLLGNDFPYGTLLANVLGSFVIGLLYGFWNQGFWELSPSVKYGISIGFLGALTTFSSFALGTFELFEHGQHLKAMLNIISNVVLCLFVAALGVVLASKIS